MLELNSEPVGQGRERTCYIHPDDDSKLIKISHDEDTTQSRREIDFYRRLQKGREISYTHLPRFYGMEDTSRGTGMVVDLIRDFDGSISRSLRWYLDQGNPLEDYLPLLDELKTYLLDNLVIFNHDVVTRNLLLQRLDENSSRLVLIDGIGDVVFLQWLNHFPGHVRSKINRRWQRFIERLNRRLNSN